MGWYTVSVLILINISTYLVTGYPSVVIIGAGPSGIAAATRLFENNITTIKILEAENRIGGRINSVKFGDAYVDLGAEWCHGEVGNAVYNLAKDYNIFEKSLFTNKILYSNGEYVDQEIANDLYAALFQLVEGEPEPLRKDASTEEQFWNLFNSTVINKYQHDKEKLKIVLSAPHFLELAFLSLESSKSWSDVAYESEYETTLGYQNWNWNGLGYKTILEILMKKYPDSSKTLPIEFWLSKKVNKIEWRDASEEKVTVHFGTDVIKADHVIFTPSVGHLKANYEKLFEPKLPEAKIEAIKTIGFGSVMKVMLHFPQVWWNPEDLSYMMLWKEEDRLNIPTEFKQGPVENGESWLGSFYMLIPAEKNPNILIAWFTGKMIKQTEELSDQLLEDGIMYSINRFLGKKFNVTRPDKILRSSWATNPNFLGTYSYDSIKTVANAHAAMEIPLLKKDNKTPAVLFAGETTHSKYFGTVHGAIETGWREADRIIKLYKNA